MEKKYHKVAEVAAITGLSKNTIRDYCNARGQGLRLSQREIQART